VALYERAGLKETYPVIAHYWASKDYWIQAGLELMARVLLTSATPEEEMRMYEALDLSQLPIYVYKSNTARRLKTLVGRMFKDRDVRYIQKRT
jgi:hypothetical protein